MREAAVRQDFEQATLERNRLRAVRSLLERQRVANEAVGTLDAVAVALAGRDANAQVFQVRDGVLSDRQSFYLSNETERELGEVAEEFMLQYYTGPIDPGSDPRAAGARRARGFDRGAVEPPRGPVELRARSGGTSADPRARRAQRPPRTRPGAPAQRAPAPSRVEALEGLQRALGLDAPPVRIECFDISNLGGTHTVASMVVFEGGAPKKSDYRRFTIRGVEGSDDYASMAEVLEPALRPLGPAGRPLPPRPRLRSGASPPSRTWS